MRLLSFVIGWLLLLAFCPNAVFAQHGNGGGHASHGHSGPTSTTQSTLSRGHVSAGQTIYPAPLGLQHQYSGYTGIYPGVLNNSGIRRGPARGYRNYGYASGLWYPPYYLSTLDDSETPYVYNTAASDAAEQNAEVNANFLGEQVARLSAEVEALRNEREFVAVPAQRPPYQAPPEDDSGATVPITLVLQSGKQLQLKNYAIMNSDIWDFSTQPAKRIPLSTVNVNASKNATEAKGGEFPSLPNS